MYIERILIIFQKRIYSPPEDRVIFKCDVCGGMYEIEFECKMHERLYEGGNETWNRHECVKCGEWILKRLRCALRER